MIKILSFNENNYCVYYLFIFLIIVLMDLNNFYCSGNNGQSFIDAAATATTVIPNSTNKFYMKHRRKSIQMNNYPLIWTNNCPDNQREHFSWKTYKSDIVLLVKAQLISSHSRRRERRKKNKTITVQFVKLNVLKNNDNNSNNSIFLPMNNIIMLNFISRKRIENNTNNNDNLNTNCKKRIKSHKLINAIANIKINEEYLLFINIDSTNSSRRRRRYYLNWTPEKIGRNEKNGIMKVVRKICSENFRPSETNEITKLMEKSQKRNRLKLLCKFIGLPIHQLYWKRNNTTLKPNGETIRINYVNTWSTIVITDAKETDYSRYECIIHSLNGSIVSKTIDIIGRSSSIRYDNPYSKEPCVGEHRRNLCLNNGTCFMDVNPQNYYCECSDGFFGERCEWKSSPQINTANIHDSCGFGTDLTE